MSFSEVSAPTAQITAAGQIDKTHNITGSTIFIIFLSDFFAVIILSLSLSNYLLCYFIIVFGVCQQEFSAIFKNNQKTQNSR